MLFGPFESVVFLSEYDKLAKDLRYNKFTNSINENTPADLSKEQIKVLIPKLGIDVCPWLNCKNLGKIDIDVMTVYKRGERIFVVFTGGNPRINFTKITSYL